MKSEEFTPIARRFLKSNFPDIGFLHSLTQRKTMKLALIALTVMLASVSHAEVKPFGTFVPNLCSNEVVGPTTKVVSVKSVCVGTLVGYKDQVIQLSINDGAKYLYSMNLDTQFKPQMGNQSSTFHGNILILKMMDRITGSFSTSSGITVTYGIDLKTQSNLKFRGTLQPVFVTQ
jgi:hypothetical protein